jgi:hypothetical protein
LTNRPEETYGVEIERLHQSNTIWRRYSMERAQIRELAVQSLDGGMYNAFRKYLEKRGCIWTEERNKWGQLLSVHLTFLPGTVYKELPPIGEFDRYQITFEKGGLMFWSVRRTTRLNSMSIPYVYL